MSEIKYKNKVINIYSDNDYSINSSLTKVCIR